jgi:Homeodomain-like domain
MATDRLTSKAQKAITDALRAGAIAEDAARATGVSRRTYHRWLQRGEAADAPPRFVAFANAVRKTESEARIAAVTAITDAMPEDWRAALAYLERRYPAEWARTSRLEHTGAEGGPVEVKGSRDLSRLSMAELEQLQALEQKMGVDDGS